MIVAELCTVLDHYVANLDLTALDMRSGQLEVYVAIDDSAPVRLQSVNYERPGIRRRTRHQGERMNATAAVNRHFTWCDPVDCTATGNGSHHSGEVAVPLGADVCSATLSLHAGGDGPVLVALEMCHDPDISAALGMSTEADSFLYTIKQAEQIHRALAALLRAAGREPAKD